MLSFNGEVLLFYNVAEGASPLLVRGQEYYFFEVFATTSSKKQYICSGASREKKSLLLAF